MRRRTEKNPKILIAPASFATAIGGRSKPSTIRKVAGPPRDRPSAAVRRARPDRRPQKQGGKYCPARRLRQRPGTAAQGAEGADRRLANDPADRGQGQASDHDHALRARGTRGAGPGDPHGRRGRGRRRRRRQAQGRGPPLEALRSGRGRAARRRILERGRAPMLRPPDLTRKVHPVPQGSHAIRARRAAGTHPGVAARAHATREAHRSRRRNFRESFP